MRPAGVANLRAALAGRAAKIAYEASAPEFDRDTFIDADWAALAGPWSWFDSVVGQGLAGGPDGLVDDDIAYVSPWGVDCARIARPVLLLHGGRDRMVPKQHAEWLARRCPSATLWLRSDNRHLSALAGADRALAWLAERAAG